MTTKNKQRPKGSGVNDLFVGFSGVCGFAQGGDLRVEELGG